MNAFKRFVMGFVVGVGIMYWYLHYSETTKNDTLAWFHGAASNYRDDRQHEAARNALGDR